MNKFTRSIIISGMVVGIGTALIPPVVHSSDNWVHTNNISIG